MLTNPRLLTALCMYLCLHCFVVHAQLHFEQIGNTKLIPDNVVTDLAQDLDGYMWIATTAGAVRYDGYRFKLFQNDPRDDTSLGGNFIRDINVFEDGTLWFATEPGGVSIYHPDTENFRRLFNEKTLSETPQLSSVSQVLKGKNNELWLSTNSGVYRVTLQGKVLRHYTKVDGLPHNGVRALLRDRNGDVWVGTRAGLARYKNSDDSFESVTPVSSESLYIRSLFESQDGRIWVGTNAMGLFVLEPETQSLQPVLQNLPDELRQSSIYDLFQFSETEIWVARFGGIDRIDAKTGNWLTRIFHDPSDSYGLANNDIRALLRDTSGMLWIGGYGSGVQRLLSNPTWQSALRFSTLRQNALSESNVSSLLALKDGTIWVGTRGGGINIVKPGKGVVARYEPKPGEAGKLQSGWITAMTLHPSGDIWVAANPGQLYRFDKNTESFSLYGAQQGLPRGNIRALEPSVNGGLWIGTNSGLMYWDNESDSFTRYTPLHAESARVSTNALHEDPNGQLWVATGATGLYVSLPDKDYLEPVTGVDENDTSLEGLSIVGMLKDSKGRLWLDTPAGLYSTRFLSETQVQLENQSQKAGYGGRPMGANLLEDESGNIWSPGYIYQPETGVMTPLQRADGVDIGTSWFRSFAKTHDGKFLFGGSRGMLTMDPNNYQNWNFAPPVVVAELRIDGVHVNAGLLSQNGMQLTPDQRSFSIEFSALDLTAPEQNRYRYQLIGFDENWIETDSTRRLASYSNLWPGTYTFKAQGTNRAGQWSDKELSFNVIIKAAVWQTPWFIGASVIVLSTIIYLGFVLRTRWIEARAQELEQQVNERTLELKKAQQDIIEQEKMASLGGLVAGVAHEINTPMGIALTAASGLSDDHKMIDKKVTENKLKRSDLTKYISKANSANDIILSSLGRASELVASFKQLAVDQTSEQRRQFDMRRLLQDMERSLHSLYSNNGHQLVFSCPEGLLLDSYPGAMFQVFTNLINNSVIHGFGEEGEGLIKIKAEADEKYLYIRYQDNGIGMTSEVRKKAFEPFFTTKLGIGGSGLGLHLVYNYITQVLGGRIKITDDAKKGFGCIIEIPLNAPQTQKMS